MWQDCHEEVFSSRNRQVFIFACSPYCLTYAWEYMPDPRIVSSGTGNQATFSSQTKKKYQQCSEVGQGYINLYEPQSSLQSQCTHKSPSFNKYLLIRRVPMCLFFSQIQCSSSSSVFLPLLQMLALLSYKRQQR